MKQLLLDVRPELLEDVVARVRRESDCPAHHGVAIVAQPVRIPAIGQERDAVSRGEPHKRERLLATVAMAQEHLPERVPRTPQVRALSRAIIGRVLMPDRLFRRSQR